MSSPRKIIIAVDQGETSRGAFQWALKNFLKSTDRVLILTAFSYTPAGSMNTIDIAVGGEYAVPIVVPVDTSVEKELAQRSQEIVDSYLVQCRQANIPSEGGIVKGDAGSHICSEAEKFNADLVIVGTHDYGLIKRTIWGSVSTYVVHNSPVPVIVVRGQTGSEDAAPSDSGLEPRTVAVAVDESQESLYAFSWTLDNLVLSSDKLILIHVTIDQPLSSTNPEDVVFEEGFVVANSDKAAVEELNSGEKLIELLMKRVKEKDSQIQSEGRIVSGGAEVKLCAELEAVKADVAVVGTRNSSAFIKTLLGSVSDHLIHHSPCPVIVAKIPVTKNPSAKSD